MTPSGCWSSACSAAPSRWPKSKSPVPTAVWTRTPSASRSTQRSAEVSESATHSRSPAGGEPGRLREPRLGRRARRPGPRWWCRRRPRRCRVAGSYVHSWCTPGHGDPHPVRRTRRRPTARRGPPRGPGREVGGALPPLPAGAGERGRPRRSRGRARAARGSRCRRRPPCRRAAARGPAAR